MHILIIQVETFYFFREPDRDTLVSGSRVLALHDNNDIWHRGTIEDVLEERAGFSFNCSHCLQVVEVNIEAMVPLFADEDIDNATTDEVIQIFFLRHFL